MKSYQENLKAADELLAKAAEVESTKRCHFAKTYAEMATGHAALAHVQLLALLHEAPRLVTGDINVSSDPMRLGKMLWTLPESPTMGEHQSRAVRERAAEELNVTSKPIQDRPYPYNVIKATKAYHSGTDSDLSRDEPSYFVVTDVTPEHFIGHWLEGAGFLGVAVERSGCSRITIREHLILARSKVEVI